VRGRTWLSVARSSGCQRAGRAGRFLARGWAWSCGGRAAPGCPGGWGPAGLGAGPAGGWRSEGLRALGVAVGASGSLEETRQ